VFPESQLLLASNFTSPFRPFVFAFAAFGARPSGLGEAAWLAALALGGILFSMQGEDILSL